MAHLRPKALTILVTALLLTTQTQTTQPLPAISLMAGDTAQIPATTLFATKPPQTLTSNQAFITNPEKVNPAVMPITTPTKYYKLDSVNITTQKKLVFFDPKNLIFTDVGVDVTTGIAVPELFYGAVNASTSEIQPKKFTLPRKKGVVVTPGLATHSRILYQQNDPVVLVSGFPIKKGVKCHFLDLKNSLKEVLDWDCFADEDTTELLNSTNYEVRSALGQEKGQNLIFYFKQNSPISGKDKALKNTKIYMIEVQNTNTQVKTLDLAGLKTPSNQAITSINSLTVVSNNPKKDTKTAYLVANVAKSQNLVFLACEYSMTNLALANCLDVQLTNSNKIAGFTPANILSGGSVEVLVDSTKNSIFVASFSSAAQQMASVDAATSNPSFLNEFSYKAGSVASLDLVNTTALPGDLTLKSRLISVHGDVVEALNGPDDRISFALSQNYVDGYEAPLNFQTYVEVSKTDFKDGGLLNYMINATDAQIYYQSATKEVILATLTNQTLELFMHSVDPAQAGKGPGNQINIKIVPSTLQNIQKMARIQNMKNLEKTKNGASGQQYTFKFSLATRYGLPNTLTNQTLTFTFDKNAQKLSSPLQRSITATQPKNFFKALPFDNRLVTGRIFSDSLDTKTFFSSKFSTKTNTFTAFDATSGAKIDPVASKSVLLGDYLISFAVNNTYSATPSIYRCKMLLMTSNELSCQFVKKTAIQGNSVDLARLEWFGDYILVFSYLETKGVVSKTFVTTIELGSGSSKAFAVDATADGVVESYSTLYHNRAVYLSLLLKKMTPAPKLDTVERGDTFEVISDGFGQKKRDTVVRTLKVYSARLSQFENLAEVKAFNDQLTKTLKCPLQHSLEFITQKDPKNPTKIGPRLTVISQCDTDSTGQLNIFYESLTVPASPIQTQVGKKGIFYTAKISSGLCFSGSYGVTINAVNSQMVTFVLNPDDSLAYMVVSDSYTSGLYQRPPRAKCLPNRRIGLIAPGYSHGGVRILDATNPLDRRNTPYLSGTSTGFSYFWKDFFYYRSDDVDTAQLLGFVNLEYPSYETSVAKFDHIEQFQLNLQNSNGDKGAKNLNVVFDVGLRSMTQNLTLNRTSTTKVILIQGIFYPLGKLFDISGGGVFEWNFEGDKNSSLQITQAVAVDTTKAIGGAALGVKVAGGYFVYSEYQEVTSKTSNSGQTVFFVGDQSLITGAKNGTGVKIGVDVGDAECQDFDFIVDAQGNYVLLAVCDLGVGGQAVHVAKFDPTSGKVSGLASLSLASGLYTNVKGGYIGVKSAGFGRAGSRNSLWMGDGVGVDEPRYYIALSSPSRRIVDIYSLAAPLSPTSTFQMVEVFGEGALVNSFTFARAVNNTQSLLLVYRTLDEDYEYKATELSYDATKKQETITQYPLSNDLDDDVSKIYCKETECLIVKDSISLRVGSLILRGTPSKTAEINITETYETYQGFSSLVVDFNSQYVVSGGYQTIDHLDTVKLMTEPDLAGLLVYKRQKPATPGAAPFRIAGGLSNTQLATAIRKGSSIQLFPIISKKKQFLEKETKNQHKETVESQPGALKLTDTNQTQPVLLTASGLSGAPLQVVKVGQVPGFKVNCNALDLNISAINLRYGTNSEVRMDTFTETTLPPNSNSTSNTSGTGDGISPLVKWIFGGIIVVIIIIVAIVLFCVCKTPETEEDYEDDDVDDYDTIVHDSTYLDPESDIMDMVAKKSKSGKSDGSVIDSSGNEGF